jgi:hypothetical protein
LKLSDEWARLYRRLGERLSDACVLKTDRFSGGSVMKWGGRSHVERTDLKVIDGNLNAVRYRDEIIAPIFTAFST